MADCEPLFGEGLRQFVDACAYINAALPNEAEVAPWTVTMHRLAASAAEAAENLENPSVSEIALMGRGDNESQLWGGSGRSVIGKEWSKAAIRGAHAYDGYRPTPVVRSVHAERLALTIAALASSVGLFLRESLIHSIKGSTQICFRRVLFT